MRALRQRSLTQTLEQRVVRVARTPHVVVHLPVPLINKERELLEDDIPHVLQSTSSSTSCSSVVQIGTFAHFLDQWGSITSNRFVFNMVKGYHNSLGHGLHCSVIFSGSTVRLLWLIILLSRRKSRSTGVFSQGDQ